MIPMTSNVEFAGRAFRPTNLAGRARSEPDCGPAHLEFCVSGAGTQQTRTLKTGESLFMQGDEVRSICVLRDGWAFRYQCLEDGRRQIVDFVLPGDVLGIGPSPQMLYGVEALSPCTWIAISRESFFGNLRQQPALSMKLVDMLSAGQARAFEQMTSVGRRTARERVAHLLLDLARRVRKSASEYEGIEITMPLMLSHIGDALGLATETVCRCLGELKRAGILIFAAGRLEILDLEGLSDLVGVPIEIEEEEASDSHRRRLVA
jgi:CRP/FNR family transcriptional regulator, anaerobic regulatory protein